MEVAIREELRAKARAKAFERGSEGRLRLAIFLSAFLLFQVQFIAARQILPWFGGVPAVWTTAMLFFQLLLLAGYAWALGLDRRLPARRQALAHGALLAAALGWLALRTGLGGSPLAPPSSLAPGSPDLPVLRVLAILLASVGLPYFALAATGPLLQSWSARLHPGADPYPLYALSNLGSLVGLVAYPALVEPAFSLPRQGVLWGLGFALFAAAALGVAVRLARASPAEIPAPGRAGAEDAPERRTIVFWIALAAGPSALLLATTHQLCQEVAVVPFLWMLPLALYLLSWILCFRPSSRGPAPAAWGGRSAAASAAAALVLVRGAEVGLSIQIAIFSAALFAAAMACHGALARTRPAPARLTSFYLAVALGGALGGALVALAAPVFFRALWELPLSLFGCGLLALWALFRSPGIGVSKAAGATAADREEASPPPLGPSALGLGVSVFAAVALLLVAVRTPLPARAVAPAALAAGLGAAGAFAALLRKAPNAPVSRAQAGLRGTALASCLLLGVCLARGAFPGDGGARLAQVRNFYGLVRVSERVGESTGRRFRALEHGRATHGIEYLDEPWRSRPNAYYGPGSGVARALGALRERGGGRGLRVGVAGLGAGTLAAFGRPGDSFRFYEINPAVIALARGPRALFGYLDRSPARIEVVSGDARIALERELAAGRPGRFDLFAADAFSSDAIPVHLLTREALDLDLAHLAPGGIVAFNLSNRFLDLRPVARRLAAAGGLALALVEQPLRTELEWPSRWALLARDRSVLDAPAIREAAEAEPGELGPLWTDDSTPLFRSVEW